jgi:hypothetical protein
MRLVFPLWPGEHRGSPLRESLVGRHKHCFVQKVKNISRLEVLILPFSLLTARMGATREKVARAASNVRTANQVVAAWYAMLETDEGATPLERPSKQNLEPKRSSSRFTNTF